MATPAASLHSSVPQAASAAPDPTVIHGGQMQALRDIWLVILSSLSARELGVAARANRFLCRVSSDNSLWKPLFQKQFRDQTTYASYKAKYIAVLKDNAAFRVLLKDSSTRIYQDEQIKELAQSHPHTPFFKLEGGGENVSDRGLAAIRENCFNIRKFTVKAEENLFWFFSYPGVIEFIAHYPNMRSLKLGGCSHLGEEELIQAVIAHPSISKLNLITEPPLSGQSVKAVTDTFKGGSARFTYLELSMPDEDTSKELFSQARGMKHLGLNNNHGVNDAEMVSFLQRNPDLKFLRLGDVRNLSENSSHALAKHGKNLQVLILGDCSTRFKRVLTTLHQNKTEMPKLRHLSLNDEIIRSQA